MCTLPNRTSLPGPVAYLHQRGTRRKSLNTRFRAGKWQKTHTLRAVRERRRARRAPARGESENLRPVRGVGFRLLEDACRHRDHADASCLWRSRIARAQVVSGIWSRVSISAPDAAVAAQRWASGTADKRTRACERAQAGGRGGTSPARVCGDTQLLQGRDTEAVLGAFLRAFAPLAPAGRPPHVRLQASRANPIGPHHFGSGARALPPPCPSALHAADAPVCGAVARVQHRASARTAARQQVAGRRGKKAPLGQATRLGRGVPVTALLLVHQHGSP